MWFLSINLFILNFVVKFISFANRIVLPFVCLNSQFDFVKCKFVILIIYFDGFLSVF